ncbi:DUF6326 family protein [Ruania alba]|uniref:Uncharacterized protein n=1 Tax=Ruania alba TaxID=648782 RepID=A0A1H5HCL7_9MICO|nr:DUF6326 family protein [Ruania alba]SEE25733.1 hypothetical protein SAMN04488554_1922 [Ruania alba]
MTTLPTESRPLEAAGRRGSPRRLVSALWLFVILCYLYCDVLGFYYEPHLRELLAGQVGSIAVTQGFLLGSAVLMTIPMAMTLVSRVAPHSVARWATVGAAGFMTIVQAASLLVGSNTLHYLYFSVIEIATTGFLAYYAAFRWRGDRSGEG